MKNINEYIQEALMGTYPVRLFIKALSNVINIIDYKEQNIFTPEPEDSKLKSNIGVLCRTDKNYINNADSIEQVCDKYGYYLCKVDNDGNDYILYFYPKMQSSFLLKNEKILCHVTDAISASKIYKSGFKPYSASTKYDNIKKYNQSKPKDSESSQLKERSAFTHLDKIHFIVGSAISKISMTFIKNLIENFNNPVILFIDVNKLNSDIRFSVDPNSSAKFLSTVWTTDNISSEAIVDRLYLNKKPDLIKLRSEIRNIIKMNS